MNTKTLDTGNSLYKKIKEFDAALNCFERSFQHDPNEPPIIQDLKPALIIEFDDCDDGREQIKLPMNLSDALIGFMKNEIIKNRDLLQKEFDAL